MSGEILIVGEAGKHAGGITTLLYDNDHVYSGGIDGVINVRLLLMMSVTICGKDVDEKIIIIKSHPGEMRY